MGKTLFYIGNEKPIINIKKYGFFNEILKRQFITLTTHKILSKHSDLPNPIGFNSNWLPHEIEIFHLNLLWKNLFSRNNNGLNIDLRAKCLGPYKLRSLKILFHSLGYLRASISQTKWIPLIKLYNKSPNLFLNELRKLKKIGNGDTSQFKEILVNNDISNVITFSTFRDPKLYDLVTACNYKKIEIHVFIECWDNISTAYAIPTGITKIYLWSEQQRDEIKRFYPEYSNKIEVIGGYRINKALISFKDQVQPKSKTRLNILYLEGYFYEDLTFITKKIIHLIEMHIKSYNHICSEVRMVFRRYPLKRQTTSINSNLSFIESKFVIDKISFHLMESINLSLYDDLDQSDLVISELTTAALEAAFTRKPVIFISAKKSPRFLDSSRGYVYSFASKVHNHFYYIQFPRFIPLRLIPKYFKKANSKKLIYNALLESNSPISSILDYYAIPFNFDRYSTIIVELAAK